MRKTAVVKRSGRIKRETKSDRDEDTSSDSDEDAAVSKEMQKNFVDESDLDIDESLDEHDDSGNA